MIHFIDRFKEVKLWQKTVKEIKNNKKIKIDSDTLLMNVSPDYSSIISMQTIHELSYEHVPLDMFNVEVPYPGFNNMSYREKFRSDFQHIFKDYKTFILMEAGVITGNNYDWIINTEMIKNFNIKPDNILSVALCEHIDSNFKCDIVGEKYNGDLTFYFEKPNRYWS
jgi:hypothetical protein